MYDDAAIDAALAKDKTEIYAKAFTAPYSIASFEAKSEVVNVAPVTDTVLHAITAAPDKFQANIKYSGADKTAAVSYTQLFLFHLRGLGDAYDGKSPVRNILRQKALRVFSLF